jgi:hypothetical protein
MKLKGTALRRAWSVRREMCPFKLVFAQKAKAIGVRGASDPPCVELRVATLRNVKDDGNFTGLAQEANHTGKKVGDEPNMTRIIRTPVAKVRKWKYKQDEIELTTS